jgi:hypothetical protein
MYQVATPNRVMMNAFQNVISGKPDCWDIVSEHSSLEEAEKAAKKNRGRVRIRLSDDPNPNHVISEKYCINPAREPELAEKIADKWEKEQESYN